MTAKEYLSQFRNYEKRIARLNADISRLEEAATNTAATLSGMPHNPSPSKSRMADMVDRIVDQQAALEEEKAQLELLRGEATLLIAQIPDSDQRDVLAKRYLDGLPWENVITEMGYERSVVYRKHKKALLSLQEFLPQ